MLGRRVEFGVGNGDAFFECCCPDRKYDERGGGARPTRFQSALLLSGARYDFRIAGDVWDTGLGI